MFPSPSQTPETLPSSTSKITRGHSCIICQQRKVKCDKQKPCSNCVKAGAECIPSAPTVPRRRRRKFTEQDLAARLRRCEQLLKRHGVEIDDDDTHDDRPQPSVERGIALGIPVKPKVDKGFLYADRQNSRYVENILWENLRDEIQDPKDLQTSSDDETNETGLYPQPESFLLGHGTASKDLSSLHPPPVQIFRLWQTYLVNVNPLTKLFHAPTTQQAILDAIGNLEKVPRPMEALMFSIYLLAVTSLQNEECESMCGESRLSLLSKYSHATQQALINAKFLKSPNLSCLQALALYLLALRKAYDHHSLWVLTGAAVRIAQRLGIHRDGSRHQVSPFDTELRRRTWWQVVFLDGQASKLAGAGFPEWLTKFDVKMPLNISDSDLSPGMKETPVEKEGVTEMLFCCLRYEVVDSFRKSHIFMDRGIGEWAKAGPELIAKKDRDIDELEIRFEKRYLRYCDPSIPLHLLAIYMSKSVICVMRLMAHHPSQYPDKGASMPQKEKDMLFTESLKELEIAAMGFSNKTVQGFQWHIHLHFQLDAFIYVVSELRHRTTGDQADRAWQQVQNAYDHRLEMIKETKNSLYFAIGNLVLKAWGKREEAGALYQRPYQLTTPRFISVLRSQRNIPEPERPSTEFRTEDPYMRSKRVVDFGNENLPELGAQNSFNEQWKSVDFGYDAKIPDITPVDWEYWQTLMDGDLPTYTGDFAETVPL